MRYIIPFLITLALLKLYESILDDMAHKDLSDKDSIIVNAENNNNNMNYKKNKYEYGVECVVMANKSTNFEINRLT